MDDGGGLYVFDMLSFLTEHGVKVEVDWSDPHGSITKRGWWVVPRNIHKSFTLRFPGDIAIGRLRLFPGIFYYPFKARFLHYTKAALQRLGLFTLLGHRRDQSTNAVPSTAPAPAPDASLPAWIALPSSEETAFARKRARAFRPTAVLTNFCWLNPLFEEVPAFDGKPPLRLTVTQDVWHIKAARMAELPNEKAFALFDLALEKRLLMQTDVTIAISEEDAVLFREFLPGRQVLTVPMGFGLTPLAEDPIPGRCLFVGSGNSPNIEGLKWFFAEVWPLVLKECPEADLIVCGNINEAFPGAAFPNVKFVGRQESLEPLYSQAQVVLCPLLRGGGMKIKLVEALSYGKACVTTSTGLQGLPFLSEAVIQADDAASFSAGILSLFRDECLRNTIQANALSCMKEHLSREACYEPLLKLVQ